MRKDGRCPKGHFATIIGQTIICKKCNWKEDATYKDHFASFDIKHNADNCIKRNEENEINFKLQGMI